MALSVAQREQRNEAIIELWWSGLNSRTLPEALVESLGVEYRVSQSTVKYVLRKARREKHPRAVRRWGQLAIKLANGPRELLEKEARARATTAAELATLLLDVIVKDNLFDAIIDDDSVPRSRLQLPTG